MCLFVSVGLLVYVYGRALWFSADSVGGRGEEENIPHRPSGTQYSMKATPPVPEGYIYTGCLTGLSGNIVKGSEKTRNQKRVELLLRESWEKVCFWRSCSPPAVLRKTRSAWVAGHASRWRTWMAVLCQVARHLFPFSLSCSFSLFLSFYLSASSW